jgi:SAM-dependent methyltransferase
MMNVINAYDKLEHVSRAFQESCLLAAGAELDLFTLILEGGNQVSASEISLKCGTDLRSTIILLDALVASEYLIKQHDEYAVEANYSVADGFCELLDNRSANTFIPMIRHMSCVQRAWGQLAKTVKTGTPPTVPPSILGAEQDRLSFILAMNSIARQLTEMNVDVLRKAGLLNFKKFIDIGGASGTYAVAFLRALPESEGTIFDLPVGIAAAKERFAGTEFENRIKLVEGDIKQNNFPEGFDFAWLSAIIHQFDHATNSLLYQKTFNALKSGGQIAIRDMVMNSDKTSPKAGAFFAINMLVETDAGAVYTFDEIKSGLKKAGFNNIKFTAQTDTMSSIITAKKP